MRELSARTGVVVRVVTEVSNDAKLGPWCVINKIAYARRRTVYAVKHCNTHQLAALDLYDAASTGFSSCIGPLRALMHLLNRVGHAGIAKIYDVGTIADGRPYVVRESIAGDTLAARIATKPPPSSEGIEILLEICDVLAAAHAAGIVHGTLTLDHVILVAANDDWDQPRIKLVDWGISDLVREDKPGSLVDHHDVLPAADVYALGIIMHRILVEVPAVLARLWTAMLSRDPAARPTLAEVALCLRAIEPAELGTTPPPRPNAFAPQPAGRASTRSSARVSVQIPALQRKATPPPVPVLKPKAVPPPLPPLARRPRATTAATLPPASGDALASSPPVHAPTVVPAPIVIETESQLGTLGDVTPPEIEIIDVRPFASLRGPRGRRAIVMASALALGAAIWFAGQARDRGASGAAPAVAVAVNEPPEPAFADTAVRTDTSPVQAPSRVTRPVAGVAATDAPAESTTPAQPTVDDASPTKLAAVTGTDSEIGADTSKGLGELPIKPLLATYDPQSDPDDRKRLAALHERIGARLAELERELGPHAVTDVSARFKWIRLDSALATPTSRRLLAKTLRDLQVKLDRVVGVD